MFCKYCGKEIKDNSEFCPYCGKRQTNDDAEKTVKDEKDEKDVQNTQNVQESAAAETKKRSPLKTGLIIAACVLVVTGAAAGIILAVNRSDNTGDLAASAETGTAETVDLSDKSGDYKTAYTYASENALRIIQREMQNSVLSSVESNKYTAQYRNEDGDFVHPIDWDEDTFEAYVEELDPQKFEEYIGQELPDQSYTFPDYYLDDDGVAVYFKDYDVVKEFRDADESVYKVCVTDCFQREELNEDSSEFVTDKSTVLCINGDYAFVRSQDTVEDIAVLMSSLSGYQTVYSVVQTLVGNTAGYDDDDAVKGRKEALTEYLDKWEDAHTQWETEFLESYGLEGKISDVNGNFNETEFDEGSVLNDTEFDENSASDDDGTVEDTEEAADADDETGDDMEEDSDADENTSADSYERTVEDYIYQIVDRGGSHHYSFVYGLFADSVTTDIGTDGKVQISRKDGDVNRVYFSFDKEGNSIYDFGQQLYVPYEKTFLGSITVQFQPGEVIGVTPSGNGLTCEAGNDMELGDYYSLFWTKADGSTQELMRVSDIKPVIPEEDDADDPGYGYNVEFNSVYPTDYVYTDEWEVSYSIDNADGGSWGTILINLETGEYTEKEAEKEFDVFNPQDYYEEEEAEDDGVVVPDSYVQISPDYYMDTATWDVYARNNLDSRVARLDEGQGVESLSYNEEQDVYWVITNTSYFYKLDGAFNQVAEPFKLPDEKANNTPYGAFVVSDGIASLYDENNRIVLQSPTSGNLLVCGFATFNLQDAYNFSTNEYIRISKEETE